MHTRKLGNSGLSVSAIGLGCMSLSGIYGEANDEESVALIHHALSLGVNFLDSSDMYGWGHNEIVIGKAIKGRRQEVVLATKFAYLRNDDGSMSINGRPEYVQSACEASLQRLGTDVIDLYYMHRVDDKVPIEETVGGMSRLVEQGKVRYLGLSEAAPETVRRAHGVHPLAALQTEYSLLFREAADEAQPTCRELDVAFVAYSPLARALLSGAIHGSEDVPEGDRRLAHPRFQEGNLEKNVSLVQRIEEIAAEKGVKPSQLALAWLLAQGGDIVPIPGTKRRSHMAENLETLDIELSADQITAIGNALDADAVAGNRYPEAQLARLGI